jgi:ABC-2 type transport system permease protein
MSEAATNTAELQEVTGPSALGGGWRRFFSLLWLMSVTEFRRIYFGTVLGYVWSLIRPLLFFAVLLFVFTQILLLGIVLYSFFQDSTQTAVQSVVAQEAVVRKTQFPRLVIPLAVVLTGWFNFTLNLSVVAVFILAWGVDPSWTWLLFPVALLALFIFTTAMAMLLSALYVRFRDVAIIWAVLSTVFFYGTPILYPIEIVPEQYRNFILFNPLAPIFEQVRVWVLDPTAPTAVEAAGGWAGLIPAIAIFIGACVAGAWVFAREAPRIAEEL